MRITAALVAAAAVLAGADSGATLFTAVEPLTLRLEAPLADLFAHKSVDDGYSVDGTLSYTDGGRETTIPGVKVSVRGHTSRRDSECSFPKLKVDFASPPAEPLFAGMKSLKIGTHCGESTDGSLTARFGRLPSDDSPRREAVVYRLLDAVGIPTLRARPARVTYVDPSGAGAGRERQAVLIESDGDAMRRLGGSREIAAEAFTTAHAMFSADDAARLAFAQAMIGNFDWCLKFFDNDTYRCDARRKLWNVTAIDVGSGRARPLMYDFDVAGMVTGKHHWFADVYNEAFVDPRSRPALEVMGQVQRTRTLFDRAVLDAARAHFVGRKAQALRAVDASNLDPQGGRVIHEYFDAFFAAIEPDAAFYRPVVTASGVVPFSDAGRTHAVCQTIGAIPVGTPVSDVRDRREGMIQVVLLDALWKWAPPARCPEIHRSAVWIPADSVSADYPGR